MAFVYRAAFAVGSATAGAGVSLMSTISPPCYRAPDESTNPSHHRHTERPGVTLQTLWDPTIRPRVPSRYLPPSISPISSSSHSPPLSSTSSRSGEEASTSAARTAADDASPSDLEFALSTSRPLTVFTTLALEQLYNQRSELLQEVTQLQDALLRLDAEWEQAVRGRDRDIEELQTEHDEAKAAWKEIDQKLDLSRVELAQLRENCDGLRAARDVAHDELRVVQDELRDTQDELNGVQNELGGVQDELGGAQDELVNVQNELSGVQDELLRATAELSDVTSKRDASHVQLDAIRRSHEEVSSDLATRRAELHQCAEAYRSEHGRLGDLRGEVGTLTKSLERTQLALSGATQRAKREEDDARTRLSELHKEIRKADETMAARTKQTRDQHHRDSTLLAEVQSSLSAAKREKDIEISRLQGDAKAMRNSFTHMQNEAHSANAELAKTRRSHEEAETALAVVLTRKKMAESEAQVAMAAASRSKDAAHQAKEDLADIKAQILNAVSILEHTKTVSDSTTGAGLSTDSGQPAKNPSHIRTDPISEYGGAATAHTPGPHEHKSEPQDTTSGGILNRLGGWLVGGSQPQPQPPPPPPVAPVLPKTGNRITGAARKRPEQDPTLTPPVSPQTHRTTSHPSASVANTTTPLDVPASAAAQQSTPAMISLESPAGTVSVHPLAKLISTGDKTMTSTSGELSANGNDGAAESRASVHRPRKVMAQVLASPSNSSAPLPKDKNLAAVSEPATSHKDDAAVTAKGAAVTSGMPEVETGAKSSSEVAKADASDRQDEASITTEDKTQGSTEATTNDTMNESPGPGEEALPLLGVVKAPEDQPSTTEVVPTPASPQDATPAPAVSPAPPVVSGESPIVEPQTDVQPKNDISVKTSQVPVDSAMETPASPYKAYSDDEIISFTPGAKVWPVVMLEVILPSAYSKAPPDLDDRVTAPKGGKTRP